MQASRALGYEPALDGLRALCWFAVLGFHAELPGLSGGFLGVSTFFTLSGFLITLLLLHERESTGAISLAGFWQRRVRRLLPAALVTLLAVALTSPLWIGAAERERLAGDVVFSAAYLINWRLLDAGYAYALIFTSPSALQHFWSLAIEGQLYVVVPIVLWLCLGAGSGAPRRGRALAGLSLLLAASVFAAIPVVLDEDAMSRVYYGTDARAAELLVGALLALCWSGRAERASPESSRLLALSAALAAAFVVGCWVLVRVETPWLYRGGLLGYAFASAGIIAYALTPGSPLGAVLAWQPLRWVGSVSYAAYLFHWPLLLMLRPAGLPPWADAALVGTATLALAGGSKRFVEDPVRRARPRSARVWLLPALGGSAVVCAVAVMLSPVSELDALRWRLQERADANAPAAERLDVAFFGDSTAFQLGQGVGAWLREHEQANIRILAEVGCGVVDRGWVFNNGGWRSVDYRCADVLGRWRERLAEHQPDAAIVWTGAWEVRNWRASRDAPTEALGSTQHDARMRTRIAAALDGFESSGVPVVWLTAPVYAIGLDDGDRRSAEDRAASEPARVHRFNALVAEVVRERGAAARVVDLGGYLARLPGGEPGGTLRPDGVHLPAQRSHAVADAWLGPELRDAFDAMGVVRRGRGPSSARP